MDYNQEILNNKVFMSFINSLKLLYFPERLESEDQLSEFYSKIIGPTRERIFLIEWLLSKWSNFNLRFDIDIIHNYKNLTTSEDKIESITSLY